MKKLQILEACQTMLQLKLQSLKHVVVRSRKKRRKVQRLIRRAVHEVTEKRNEEDLQGGPLHAATAIVEKSEEDPHRGPLHEEDPHRGPLHHLDKEVVKNEEDPHRGPLHHLTKEDVLNGNEAERDSNHEVEVAAHRDIADSIRQQL